LEKEILLTGMPSGCGLEFVESYADERVGLREESGLYHVIKKGK
jgi:hypothetical protein